MHVSCTRPNTPFVAPETLGWLTDDPLEVLEQARDGVLFVTEIATLSKLEQKGLLFVLGKLEKSNVRLVCAASEPLPSTGGGRRVRCRPVPGAERTDLERASACASIARIFLILPTASWRNMLKPREAPPRHFSVAALNALRNENWPGNLPQLNNVVKTLALTSLNEEITPQDVSRVLAQFGHPPPRSRPCPDCLSICPCARCGTCSSVPISSTISPRPGET